MSRLPDSDFKEIKDDSELQLETKSAFPDIKCFLASFSSVQSGYKRMMLLKSFSKWLLFRKERFLNAQRNSSYLL